MTIQDPEMIFWDNKNHAMWTEPLAPLVSARGIKDIFKVTSSCCWRGYHGSWAVLEDRLHLVGVNGLLKSGGQLTLNSLFPDQGDQILADWFSGSVRLPMGDVIAFLNGDFGGSDDKEMHLTFEKGVLTSCTLRSTQGLTS